MVWTKRLVYITLLFMPKKWFSNWILWELVKPVLLIPTLSVADAVDPSGKIIKTAFLGIPWMVLMVVKQKGNFNLLHKGMCSLHVLTTHTLWWSVVSLIWLLNSMKITLYDTLFIGWTTSLCSRGFCSLSLIIYMTFRGEDRCYEQNNFSRFSHFCK